MWERILASHIHGTMFASTQLTKENNMQNGFDDFDTQQQSEEVYRDESLMGGKYHGPSNEAGLTAQEYYEAIAEWEEERFAW
jgi:hypothetical protein